MRIVHISVATLPVLYQYGGAIQRRIIELAAKQADHGNAVVVYSVGDSYSRCEYRGVEIRSIACKHIAKLRAIEFQMRCIADLKSEKVDILHFHSQPEGAVLSRRIAAKKYLSYDYYFFRWGRKTPLYLLYRSFLKGFTLLLPCSDYCRKESSRYWGLNPAKVRVLYNGVNTNRFRRDNELRRVEREALGIKKRVILYVGRVCEQKGTDILLHACRILNQKRNDVQLVIAGPIGQFGNVRTGVWPKLIQDVGGLYLGAVGESRLPAVYNAADVFVMPTRRLEMFGMAAVEAQACGKPVVASDHGGLRETVPETCGFRFPIGNARSLAQKIEILLDNPDIYRIASDNALKNASTYDWSVIVETLTNFYRDETAT